MEGGIVLSRQELARLRTILDGVGDSLFLHDMNGRIVAVNHRAVEESGYAEDELIKLTVADLSPEAIAAGKHGIWTQLRLGQTALVSGLHRRKDGSRYPVEARLSLIRLDGGEPLVCALVRDMTERFRLEGELGLSSRVFDCAREGILVTDAAANIIRVNQAYQRITGYGEDELLGRNPSLMSAGLHGPDFYHAMWQALRDGDHWEGEILNRRKNSTPYHSWLSITAVRGAQGQVLNYIGICSDLTERKQSQQQIERLSYFDSLTGLPNRMLMEDRLRQNISSAKRRGGYAALMLADIDRLGKINDTLGHEAGDALLKMVATRIGACIRPGDTLARYVSDEFVIILDDLSSPADAGMVAEKICAAFNDYITVGGQDISTGVSIGISVFPQDGETPEAVLRCADTAKRHVKTEGGSRYQFYSDELNQQSLEHLILEASLRKALDRHEFQLHYQPQVDLASGRIVGVEALLRWRHPDMGMISPASFIPLAEEIGEIVRIGAWVLEEACRQVKQWRELGHELKVSVNLSARQFRQRDLPGLVRGALANSGLPAQALDLELTESMVMERPDQAINVLRELQSLGVSISVDDFGTGYSSLAYLKRLPIDKLKIDRSFVADIPHDSNDMAITQAVIALAKSLNLQVVAEGVETPDQLAFLRSLGCDWMQGFLFSPAVDAETLGGFLAAGKSL